ncbi:hypothetical protein ABTN09_21355, partial [Acinetobacter baumannii]
HLFIIGKPLQPSGTTRAKKSQGEEKGAGVGRSGGRHEFQMLTSTLTVQNISLMVHGAIFYRFL